MAAHPDQRRILITNDDGIDSEGIHVLARSLADAGHDVLVVAPDGDYSGTGTALGSLSAAGDLQVRSVAIDGLEPDTCWAVSGPPGLTVVAGVLGAFGDPPDVVVSGINAGLNTGRSVLHSGTVGAALTAQNFGISALAVSVAPAETWHWDTAAALATDTLGLVIDGPPRCVVNLNVPGVAMADLQGIRWAHLAPFGAVQARISGIEQGELQYEVVGTDHQPAPETDQGSVDAGWAALTTLIGVAETWPEDELPDLDPNDIGTRLVPGAELQAVHRLPDADEHRSLRRPQHH